MIPSPRRFMAVLGLAALVSVSVARATAGFAEWEVRTPGGHLISHTDGFKERHGDCLRSDDPTRNESSVLVSHLRRWRYYEGFVVGESRTGFFLFDERRERFSFFDDEKQLLRALDGRVRGKALSAWLTGADGWREAWFPFFVWGPCRESLDRGAPTATGLSVEQCRQSLAPESFELLRRTTWGHVCRNLEPGDARGDGGDRIESFCAELLSPEPG